MHGGARPKAGRKSVRINLGELEKLCALQCTDEEIAAFFEVSVRTIERRRGKPAFAKAMERGKAQTTAPCTQPTPFDVIVCNAIGSVGLPL